MNIALDAVGGDFGLKPNIEAALQAASELGVRVLLVGPGDAIKAELTARGVRSGDPRFEIVDTPDSVGAHEDLVAACREKPRASIMLAAEFVSRNKASAFVSAGGSGAAMVAALWHMKRLPGVLRPAIACPIPTAKGLSVLVDAGANTECKPWHLLQFATMGSLYARHILKKEQPSVGILSNGEEEAKGDELVRETIPLLKYSGLRFHGPIEGRDIPAGAVDVVVCGGFVGNVVLKLMEGMASTIFSLLRAEVERSPVYKLGALLMRPAASSVRRRMNYDEYGGAPLLGAGGTAVVCHGRSNAKAIFNAHRVAKALVESGANDRIRAALEEMKSNLELAKVQL